MGTISEKLEYLADTKEALKQALIDQGQTVDDNTPFRNYATKVSEISGTMKEYPSETAMNNDISNIEAGEVVKVVDSGVTTYYVKEGTTTYQPFDFSTLSDGDTISLENMKINNSALCDVVISAGDYITITFSNNNVPVLEFSFNGGSTKISGSVTLNNTDMFNYSAVNMGQPLTLSDADVETINSDSIWSSSTLLTVSSDALDGSAYTKLTNALLEQVTEYSMVQLSEGTGSSVNIFAQTTEPETKKGIWLQADRTIEHIYGDDEIFIAGTWEADGKYANIPIQFESSAVTTIGTDIYLFGGSGYLSANKRKSAYKFTPSNNTFTKLTDNPNNLYPLGSAVAVGTDIYLIASGSAISIYKYDTLNNSYSFVINNTNHNIQGSAVATIGTDIYMFGSSDSSSYKIATKYDTIAGTITSLANAPYSLSQGSAVAVGTDIYIFGTGSSRLYKYNTLTDSYTQLSSTSYDSSYCKGVALGTDIYLFGGSSSTTAYKYDTLTDSYTQLSNIPYSFSSGSAGIVGSNIFLFGGSSYPTKVQCLPLTSSTYQNNSVIIAQGKYYTVGYGVELYNDDKAVLPLYYAFADAWFYTTANGIETNIPTYYGDGTNWIKIKN